MKTNYVLIDYENVQPDDIDTLQHEHVRVIVFVGPHQTKIAFEKAAALQRMGANAEYVRLSGGGANALDFHIAYYLGQLTTKDPTAHFHVISKDTGFDPLIKHLRERKLRACRVRAIREIPILKLVDPKTSPDRVAFLVANLQKQGAARLGRWRHFQARLATRFRTSSRPGGKRVGLRTEEERADGTKVTYNLPS